MEITFRSDVDVRLCQCMGSDSSVVAAAKVSVEGPAAVEALDKEAKTGLIKYLMKMRHGTPFEHASMTFFVNAPIFVWREWHRHRIGFCLAGDTEIWCETMSLNCGRTIRKRPIADIYRNWKLGVSDAIPFRVGRGISLHESGLWRATAKKDSRQVHLGYFQTEDEAQQARREWDNENPSVRTRSLVSCRNLSARTLNEQTQFFEIGRMADVFESGVKELFLLRTVAGHELRASCDHRILTADGWATLGELRTGDRIAVAGRRSKFAERVVPPSLRRGIGVWTSMQRTRLIRETDHCYVCGSQRPREMLVLDHVVPVAADLLRALDVNNLKPICEECNRIKTASEQILARRGNVAGSKYIRLSETPKRIGEGMTYDIEMEGPHHNFVANGIVVHNSYNEESGRYKTLDPVFYTAPPDRPSRKVDDWKPGRPKFEVDHKLNCRVNERNVAVYQAAYAAYLENLADGADPGFARDCLPVGIYSSCWVTCNPRSCMVFLSLRTHEPDSKFPSYPLYEMERAARKVEELFAVKFPITHAAFNEFGRVAP